MGEVRDHFIRLLARKGISYPPPPMNAPPTGIPFMITAAMKMQLRRLKYTSAQIRLMTPQQAMDILNTKGRRMYRPEFATYMSHTAFTERCRFYRGCIKDLEETATARRADKVQSAIYSAENAFIRLKREPVFVVNAAGEACRMSMFKYQHAYKPELQNA